MEKLFFFVIAVGLVVGLALPGSRAGNAPHRVETPSEPPHDTVIEMTGGGTFYTYAKVNGQLVKFVVDTGATVVALSEDDAERAGVRFDPALFTIVGRGASGPIRGEAVTIDSIELDGKLVHDIEAMVVEDSSGSLLGQSYLSHLSEVQMRGSTMVLR